MNGLANLSRLSLLVARDLLLDLLADGLVNLHRRVRWNSCDKVRRKTDLLRGLAGLLRDRHVLLGGAAGVLVGAAEEVTERAFVLGSSVRDVKARLALSVGTDLSREAIVLAGALGPEEVLRRCQFLKGSTLLINPRNDSGHR